VFPSDTSWLSEPTTGVHQFGGGSRELAKEARLDSVRDYHADLAQRLAVEATQIPRRVATLARLHEREKQVTRELGRAYLKDSG
jgi:hypothetical protein